MEALSRSAPMARGTDARRWLLLAALSAVAPQQARARAAVAEEWVNLTVYRTTPINYTGLTDMDSGDARGDVYFGLAQLLLPPLCEADPDFLWCEVRLCELRPAPRPPAAVSDRSPTHARAHTHAFLPAPAGRPRPGGRHPRA